MAFERTPRAISHAEAHKPHKDPHLHATSLQYARQYSRFQQQILHE
jgi:hypothetical protein